MSQIKLLVLIIAMFGLAAVASARDVVFLNGHAMVPLSTLQESFGAAITYDSYYGFGITLDYQTARILPGQQRGWIGAREIWLDHDVVFIHGVPYIPASFLHTAFGYDCVWDVRTQQMILVRPRTQTRVILHISRPAPRLILSYQRFLSTHVVINFPRPSSPVVYKPAPRPCCHTGYTPPPAKPSKPGHGWKPSRDGDRDRYYTPPSQPTRPGRDWTPPQRDGGRERKDTARGSGQQGRGKR